MNHWFVRGETTSTSTPMVSSTTEDGSLYGNGLLSETTHDVARQPDGHNISLQDCGQWLLSIPSVHAPALQQTPEYRDLVRSLHNLERAHARQVNSQPQQVTSFLQYHCADEMLHFILHFLEAQSLGRLAATCTRLQRLVPMHAARRAHQTMQAQPSSQQPSSQQQHQHQEERILSHPLQVVRAAEQLQGIFPQHPHVRIPSLLLRRPVVLRDAGDEDFNGIYFCTGSNGNGFVFTKPRSTVPPLTLPAIRTTAQDVEVLDPSSDRTQEPPGYRLKCIISKRFSNETLLWYCCKEVLVTSSSASSSSSTEDATAPMTADTVMISQRYAFWARLSMLGDASDYDLCRYPSQSSVLRIQGAVGWQALSNSHHIHPPTVELID